MTPQEFLDIGLKEGQSAYITLEDGKGNSRSLSLFFRGFRSRRGSPIVTSVEGLTPVFSPPNKRGCASRKYYRSFPTDLSYRSRTAWRIRREDEV